MKNLSLFDKLIFWVNTLFSVALLFAYILPYIPPKTSAFLSLLSLGVPLLIIINLVFLLYWAIRLKKQALLPLIVLLIGLHHVLSLFNFSTSSKFQPSEDTVSIMSYNVKLFNRYKWVEEKNVPERIKTFVKQESPDILCIQDYYKTDSISIESFKYSFIHTKGENSTVGQAIFSNYPMINKGSLDFPNTYNNAIYADIVIEDDTIRIFNVHLESLKIVPKEVLEKKVSGRLVRRVGQSFVMQQAQMQMIFDALKKTPYHSVICADMNNSAFSYVYRLLEEHGFKDAFKEAGTGFGKTYDFSFIPLRIDMIFVEKPIQIANFKTYDIKLSDHYPIMATVKLD